MFSSIPVISKLLTNRNVALIYSVAVFEQQKQANKKKNTKGLCTAFNVNCSTVVFVFVYVGFYNQSSLSTVFIVIRQKATSNFEAGIPSNTPMSHMPVFNSE